MLTIDSFVDLVACVDSTNCVANPYKDNSCRYNLCQYLHYILHKGVDVFLVGEAPGYRGCAITGVPFTDSAQLNNPNNRYAIGDWVRINNNKAVVERTATIMWEAIRRNHLVPLLWNAFPFHPYVEGKLLSNRTPTREELEMGSEYIVLLMELFGIKRDCVYAIGKKAKQALNVDDNHYIRHPSNDYKREFPKSFDEKIGRRFGSMIMDSI